MSHVDPRPPRTSISVCSGVGGLDLGLQRACGVEPLVYVEREAFAAACLVARMEEKALAPAPIWDDVCTFEARPWRGLVDLVAGGTPCQDLSLAGKQAGLDGERSRLFFEHVRIAVECEAPFFFWENVGGAGRVVPRVCDYLFERGYTQGVWCTLQACDVGATHERERIFLLAYSEHRGERHWARPPRRPCGEWPPVWGGSRSGVQGLGGGEPLAHSYGRGREGERIAAGNLSEMPCRDFADGRRAAARRPEWGAEYLWPTASARDWKSGEHSKETAERNARPLNESAWAWARTHLAALTSPGGPECLRYDPTLHRLCLNPGFVEWLMGWPEGWTLPFARTDSGRVATGSYRNKPHMHGTGSGASSLGDSPIKEPRR